MTAKRTGQLCRKRHPLRGSRPPWGRRLADLNRFAPPARTPGPTTSQPAFSLHLRRPGLRLHTIPGAEERPGGSFTIDRQMREAHRQTHAAEQVGRILQVKMQVRFGAVARVAAVAEDLAAVYTVAGRDGDSAADEVSV